MSADNNPEKVLCLSCDTEVSEDGTFCSDCGMMFEVEDNEIELTMDGEEKPIPKRLLLVGMIIFIFGASGIIGLRLGIVQELIFNIIPPAQILGPIELPGHIILLIPVILGLALMIKWGLKSEPIYHHNKSLKIISRKTLFQNIRHSLSSRSK